MTFPAWCGSFFAADNDVHDGDGPLTRRALHIVPAPETPLPDTPLVARLRAGDMEAFREVFDAHYPLLRRCLYRWGGDITSAEDIAQDVLVDLWHRRETLTLHASLRSYLLAAARYRLRDVRAHRSVVERHVAVMQSDPLHAVTPPADSALLSDELIQVIEQRIAAFPPRMQTIYRLSRDAGLSYAEIAAQLGISVNTVYVQVGRALAALRDVLGDWT